MVRLLWILAQIESAAVFTHAAAIEFIRGFWNSTQRLAHRESLLNYQKATASSKMSASEACYDLALCPSMRMRWQMARLTLLRRCSWVHDCLATLHGRILRVETLADALLLLPWLA